MYKTLLHTPPGGYLKRYATKGKTLVHVLSLSPPLPSPVFGVMRRNRVNWADDRTIARNDKILWLDKNGKKTDAQKQKCLNVGDLLIWRECPPLFMLLT